ncbi:Uma2 family endonuclease [Sphaerisporangium aureirubrum]|uniref:Uma2 family endonuclease n=1 Tax=Sphaerisporangium aureirubrum TaxID=1544736 RepID=A0ABW1NCN7_9ACTN
MTVLVRSDAMTDSDSQLPEWLIPPAGGFTADDLDHFPQLPAHTELLDGSLVFVSPQASFHPLMVSLLEHGLRSSAPDDVRVRREMSVVLGRRQRPEPDIIVIRDTADLGPDTTAYQAADVLLAVEVVSPDSEIRDRERKPQLYAQAGIPHFWRIEREAEPTAYIHARDPRTGEYTIIDVHRGAFKVDVPFPVEIDLNEIHKL